MQEKIKNNLICGIDEAGRGPLAGPVVSAAVILGHNFPYKHLLQDSKKLNENQRNHAFNMITQHALHWAIDVISPEIIDDINILQASLLSMKNAYNKLPIKVDVILVDGNKIPNIAGAISIVKGDSKVPEISAASILAKVCRDRIMCRYSIFYPEYGFEKHKGYGTQAHLKNIVKFGNTPIHRKTFKFDIDKIQGELF